MLGSVTDPSPHFLDAINRIDRANGDDPRRVDGDDGVEVAGGLLYSRRMTAWLDRLYPEASEALRLAARAQHVRRWEIPRDRYPMDRAGYHRWRTTLYGFHADTAGRLLGESGYDEATIARVGSLLRKERIKADAETQALEDAICLVFLEYEFADFIGAHDDEKVIGIVRRTWAKMSPVGHAAGDETSLGRAGGGIGRSGIGGMIAILRIAISFVELMPLQEIGAADPSDQRSGFDCWCFSSNSSPHPRAGCLCHGGSREIGRV